MNYYNDSFITFIARGWVVLSKKFKFVSKKPKEKWKLFSLNNDILESGLIASPHIEIFGNNEITLEGCRGVFEYSDSYIKLNLGKGSLILCGSCLDIVTFDNSRISIKGKLSSVEFCV